MSVLEAVVLISAAAFGAGVALLLRTNVGVHRPPQRQRRRANALWAGVTIVAFVVLVILLASSQ